MDEALRHRLWQQGIQLTHAGQIDEAIAVLARALEGTTGVMRGNILRDYADVVRRRLGGGTEAWACLTESLMLLEQQPLARAATMHYMGRFYRQLGDYDEAIRQIVLGYGQICTYNRRQRLTHGQHVSDELYMALDLSSVYALAGAKQAARKHARRGLVLAVEMSRFKHLLRAIVLLLFAGSPRARLQFVQRAFWGRSAS